MYLPLLGGFPPEVVIALAKWRCCHSMHTDVCSVECALEVRPLEVRPLAVRPLAVRPLEVHSLEVRRAWTAPEHGRHGWLDGLRLKHEQVNGTKIKSK